MNPNALWPRLWSQQTQEAPTNAVFIVIRIFQLQFSPRSGSLRLLGLGGFYTHWGILSYCIEKPAVEWGPGEIAILLLSSFIERFPKKCCQRSTVQAVPILFHQVIDRLPRYVMLQYFWIWKSLLLLTFWTFWSLLEHCDMFRINMFTP